MQCVADGPDSDSAVSEITKWFVRRAVTLSQQGSLIRRAPDEPFAAGDMKDLSFFSSFFYVEIIPFHPL